MISEHKRALEDCLQLIDHPRPGAPVRSSTSVGLKPLIKIYSMSAFVGLSPLHFDRRESEMRLKLPRMLDVDNMGRILGTTVLIIRRSVFLNDQECSIIDT